jgi:hypothetical protein
MEIITSNRGNAVGLTSTHRLAGLGLPSAVPSYRLPLDARRSRGVSAPHHEVPGTYCVRIGSTADMGWDAGTLVGGIDRFGTVATFQTFPPPVGPQPPRRPPV